MNRTSIATAIIAGFANPASAVNLNPNGIGQVLIYPYYTVNHQQQTLLSAVNTTSIGKAVKVRFLEGYNSREVLDFNLYLSKYDVWTAAVFSLGIQGVFTTAATATFTVLSGDTALSCVFGLQTGKRRAACGSCRWRSAIALSMT